MQNKNSYKVTLRYQYPAWDELDGITTTVEAVSKSEAVKKARREFDHAGHLMGGKGRVTLRAEESGAEAVGWARW